MTPMQVRLALETALQSLADAAKAVFQSAYEVTVDRPAQTTLRGAVVHLNELPETGNEHGVMMQEVNVVVELRSRVDNPAAAELAAQYVAQRLPGLLRQQVVMGSLRFVTPALPARDAAAPTHYAVTAIWDGAYPLGTRQ